jgi:hypothetical protein
MHEQTGGKTILRVTRMPAALTSGSPSPTAMPASIGLERHLYKNIYGNKLIFEEVNHDLQIEAAHWPGAPATALALSGAAGYRTRQPACRIELLDGLQNLLPYGATTALQTSSAACSNAYKRSELDEATGLGIFALSATLTDRAEPSESLRPPSPGRGPGRHCYLLSTRAAGCISHRSWL